MKKHLNLFKEFFESEKLAGIILIICTCISILLANSAISQNYLHFWHNYLDLSFLGIDLNYSIELWINDGLMTIFFLLVGLEIEREIYVGELSNLKKALLPIGAAIGGMVVPALIHFAFNWNHITKIGFAIPMATDIAFALGILSLAGKKIPITIKIFLTALAIIDDLGAILVIAIFYTSGISIYYLLGAFGIFFLLLILNKLNIYKLYIYLILGFIMWYFMLKSGVHATIAGVLLAFAIPFRKNKEKNISYKLQHFLHKPVAYIIIPIFALANTAIILPKSFYLALIHPNSLGIFLGLFLGKVLGIVLFSFLMIKFGIAKLYEKMNWSNLIGVGFLGGIGFTMSIFITNLAYINIDLINYSKISILVASLFSATFGLIILKTSK